jgi:hypothetical protein
VALNSIIISINKLKLWTVRFLKFAFFFYF